MFSEELEFLSFTRVLFSLLSLKPSGHFLQPESYLNCLLIASFPNVKISINNRANEPDLLFSIARVPRIALVIKISRRIPQVND